MHKSMLQKIKLDSVDTYLDSSLNILKDDLEKFFGDLSKITVNEIKDKIHHINSYENIEELEPLKESHVIILDEDKVDKKEAESIIENGHFFWEHAAAGEATRLGLGPKYFLEFSKMSIEEIHQLIVNEAKKSIKEENQKNFIETNSIENLGKIINPKQLLPISLGTRHMLQMVYDLRKYAKKKSIDADQLVKKQQTLMVINEQSGTKIVEEFIKYDFYGLKRENVFFMIQKSFYGINIKDGKPFYDKNSPKRLHNHGQMFMQKLHDHSIFYINEDNERIYLSSKEYLEMLKKHKLMLSYNIEDIGYLTSSIDWHSLGLAYKLSKEGYEMIMEIVQQNPVKPQKGGAAFIDKKLGKICMIESNRLKDIKNEDIEHLNKNFNIYPNPSIILERLKETGLPMSIDVKSSNDGEKENLHIYFCPVQGDINFLAKTAFVMRKKPKPIQNLKSPATIPATIEAMQKQDSQKGFKDLAHELVLDKII